MKSAPYTTVTSTSTHPWAPSLLREPPTKFQKISNTASAPIHQSSASLKMKTSSTATMKTRKRVSPKCSENLPTLPPLPAISTFFDSGSSSHSSSSNSSLGSYCQFSPDGSYTIYHLPMTIYPYVPETTMMASTSTSTMASPVVHCPPMSADEHKPVNQPLFIQTADYPYDYSAPDLSGGYPSSATINASQLLLRPVPNGR